MFLDQTATVYVMHGSRNRYSMHASVRNLFMSADTQLLQAVDFGGPRQAGMTWPLSLK